MVSRDSAAASRTLRTIFHLGAVAALTDGQLLARFSTHHDPAAELAFEALMQRHGPMVLGTCRAVLGDRHAAEDAFQATFLVLVGAGVRPVRPGLGPRRRPAGLDRRCAV